MILPEDDPDCEDRPTPPPPSPHLVKSLLAKTTTINGLIVSSTAMAAPDVPLSQARQVGGCSLAKNVRFSKSGFLTTTCAALSVSMSLVTLKIARIVIFHLQRLFLLRVLLAPHLPHLALHLPHLSAKIHTRIGSNASMSKSAMTVTPQSQVALLSRRRHPVETVMHLFRGTSTTSSAATEGAMMS